MIANGNYILQLYDAPGLEGAFASIRVRQSWSLHLGSSLLLFKLDLLHLAFFPHVTAHSVDWLCNFVLTCFSPVFQIGSLLSFLLLRIYVAVSLYK